MCYDQNLGQISQMLIVQFYGHLQYVSDYWIDFWLPSIFILLYFILFWEPIFNHKEKMHAAKPFFFSLMPRKPGQDASGFAQRKGVSMIVQGEKKVVHSSNILVTLTMLYIFYSLNWCTNFLNLLLTSRCFLWQTGKSVFNFL